MKHKHYDVIVAWAEGKPIQCRPCGETFWSEVMKENPTWSDHFEYRVKPKPEPETWPKTIRPGQCLCGAGSAYWHMECYQAVPPIKGSVRSVFAHAELTEKRNTEMKSTS